MATYTENYNLKKPATTDQVNIEDLNGNADIIDAALAGKAESADVSAKYTKPETGIPATDLAADVQASLGKADTALQATEKGTTNGVATLDGAGKVPAAQLPSYVDDVIEGYYYNGAFYSDAAHTEQITPETGIIYVDLHTDDTYRWSGSMYVRINDMPVDDALSDTSTNPVQNKIITAALNEKAPVIYNTASGSIASFSDGADGMPIKSLTVNIEPVQEGSGDPSPENVRPITGWTGCNLTRTGKNLLPLMHLGDYSNGGVQWTDNADGSISVSGESTTNRYYISVNAFEFSVKEGETYTASVIKKDGSISENVGVRITPYGESALPVSVGSKTFEATTNKYSLSVYLKANATNANETFFIQIELGSETTAYEPYQGNTYDISWETEAGTIYAGLIDWNDKRLKSRPYYASYNSETLVGPWISSMDVYTPGGTPTTGAQVVDLGGVETVYQLTTEQITTLLGTNNIWADCGSANVTYPSDTKLYIDGKLAELQALVLENIGG